jgi:hypothetical protein
LAQVPQPYPLGNKCTPVGSSRRHRSFLSFLLGQHTHISFQKENVWNFNESYATGGENSLPFLPPVTVSCMCFTFIDSPEHGPGTVLGASSPSVSASASNTLANTASSSTSTSIPVKGHSSNGGAIAGGIIGGIAAISIVVTALLFYLRQRHSSSPVVVFEGDGARHMDQAQFPMSDQGVLAETLPETTAPRKPYVYVFVPPKYDYVYSRVFSFLNLQNPNDPTTYPVYQAVQPPPAYVSGQMPPLSPNRSLYTVATPMTPQTQYRGLPIV